MKRLRVLLLAPDCNPDSISTPLIGYSHAEALARLHQVTLVVRSVIEEPVRRAHGPFERIEAISMPWLDRAYAWALRRIFKFDYGRQSLTASTYPLYLRFEWLAWKRLRRRIQAGEFDVVLRLMPVVSVIPSPIAFYLRKGPTPFVIGPLNGGLPWPRGFPQLDKQRRQAGFWLSNLRGLYRYLPFSRSTYARAAAIIAGSSHTYNEFSAYRHKVFFVPGENGVDPALFAQRDATRRRGAGPLELMFVGRLIPLKACDLALKASAPLVRAGKARFTIVGDGPERSGLEQLAVALGIQDAVTFTGWLGGADTMARLRQADVLVFPSLREFGGTVIFEALGLGAVPVVADFGGPGDIVHDRVGYKVPLVNQDDFVRRLQSILEHLAENRDELEVLRAQGMEYASEHLTWDGKARTVTSILLWVTGQGPKPALRPPERVRPSTAAALPPAEHRQFSPI